MLPSHGFLLIHLSPKNDLKSDLETPLKIETVKMSIFTKDINFKKKDLQETASRKQKKNLKSSGPTPPTWLFFPWKWESSPNGRDFE